VYKPPVWRQFLRQPQRVWLRRACCQIHLWTGLALGLYVVLMWGVSGIYLGILQPFANC